MPLPVRKMKRRYLLTLLSALGACGRRNNTIQGRWEGKLTNGDSSMNFNLDFLPKPDKTLDLRATCHDLFLMQQPLQTWRLEGPIFTFTLPLIEGPRTYNGRYGGPTFDVEFAAAQESLHMIRLGRPPKLPYLESGPIDFTPTQRSSRASAQIFGNSALLTHFNADLLARLGITTSSKALPGAGWVFVEDAPLPEPPKDNPPAFLILLSPAHERIAEIVRYQCPIFVLLGEADTRAQKLERGARQIAFDLREALTKQNRKDHQISIVPKADQTFRVPGFGREYPRLPAGHIDHFRRFLARFEPTAR